MWVIASYEGERAKSVLAHADVGIGYIVLERGGNRYSPSALVAFDYRGEMPLPHHFQEVKDPYKIKDYERRKRARMGLREDVL